MINGLADQRIEEIHLRLIGADHRPWQVSPPGCCDEEGRRFIAKGSKRALQKGLDKAALEALRGRNIGGQPFVAEDDGGPGMIVDPYTMARAVALYHRTDNATDDMSDFIVHAPQDIDDLLKEVACLRIMVTKFKDERDVAVKDLLGRRIAADRAEGKIVDIRRAWRTLIKELGTRPT